MSGVLAVLGVVNPSMTATAAPTYVSGSSPGFTSPVTVTVANGIGPYTYEWLPSGLNDLGPVNPNAATTRFAGTGSGDFFCQVTDTSTGDFADSNLITAEIV